MAELEIWAFSILSVLVVSAISVIGIITIYVRENRLKKYLHFFVSFAAGALFGDVFLHLLPEVSEEFGFGAEIAGIVLFALVFSFAVEKIIRWRHCHIPTSEQHEHPLGTMNLIGDAVHNFLDGLVIGASYLISVPVGIATTLAVIFHEIPQEIGDFGVLLHAGFTKKKALLFNFMIALTSVLGAVMALALGSLIENLEFFVAPFAAGLFIYIAGSDLIPEIHKNEGTLTSILDLVAFVLGILVMAALLLLE